MKKLIFSFFLASVSVTLSAQSEVPTDTIHGLSTDNFKNFDGFLLDMGAMLIAPPPLVTPRFDLRDYGTTQDYATLFRVNPSITYGQFGFTSSPFRHGIGFFGSSPLTLQMRSFKLHNGMRLNTYGEYNADGHKVYNPSALPWEKNNFTGAFEVKSANGNFGIRVEVQRGRNTPF